MIHYEIIERLYRGGNVKEDYRIGNLVFVFSFKKYFTK